MVSGLLLPVNGMVRARGDVTEYRDDRTDRPAWWRRPPTAPVRRQDTARRRVLRRCHDHFGPAGKSGRRSAELASCLGLPAAAGPRASSDRVSAQCYEVLLLALSQKKNINLVFREVK